MVFRLKHPLSGHIYSELGGGLVEVRKPSGTGVFDKFGTWVSGDVRSADIEMCRWVGTNENAVASRHRSGFTSAKATATVSPDVNSKETSIQ